ncbi:DUF423 domain-containing protein [Sinomicrobium soli]|uniref:DUF423 domain-containing protein n=1 Tax=Sinomicrobium sp. N-1-3-6 TaxID=2219864 RepID=UPI00191C56CE|nr:DUF423 domain-containing protein [Sinomicrobium sp. N-1-3-6]
MKKNILITAAFFGLTAIILGAFGAHGLKRLIDEEALLTFETGVKYQMYHALFLLFAGSTSLIPEKAGKAIFWLTTVGVIFFSGSIYGLATNGLSAFDFRTIALITPVGGALLIAAWGVLFYNFLRLKIK